MDDATLTHRDATTAFFLRATWASSFAGTGLTRVSRVRNPPPPCRLKDRCGFGQATGVQVRCPTHAMRGTRIRATAYRKIDTAVDPGCPCCKSSNSSFAVTNASVP
jgi:hypothetical protein